MTGFEIGMLMIAGSSLGLQAFLAYEGGIGEAELSEMSIESQERMAADLLGLKYDELKQGQVQFRQALEAKLEMFGKEQELTREKMKQQAGQFAKSYSLGKAGVRQAAATGLRAGVAQTEAIKTARATEQQRAATRAATSRVGPGRRTKAVTPTATAALGSDILTGQPAGAVPAAAAPLALAGGSNA